MGHNTCKFIGQFLCVVRRCPAGNNLSGIAEQFVIQFMANAPQ